MKRLFKKNQIIIATLAVMIAIAGYLNYSGILFGESEDSTTEANADLANQELLDMFNKGLANIKASGEYDEILARYLL